MVRKVYGKIFFHVRNCDFSYTSTLNRRDPLCLSGFMPVYELVYEQCMKKVHTPKTRTNDVIYCPHNVNFHAQKADIVQKRAFWCMKCSKCVGTFLLYTPPISLNTSTLYISSAEVYELLRKILIFLHFFLTPIHVVQHLFRPFQHCPAPFCPHFYTVRRLFSFLHRKREDLFYMFRIIT